MKKLLLLAAAGASFVSAVCAASEEEVMFFDPELLVPKNTFSIGYRRTSGPTAKFGNLGGVPPQTESANNLPASNPEFPNFPRRYHDGIIASSDTLVPNSDPARANPVTPNWSYASALQRSGGTMTFNTYSSTSAGATATGDGDSSTGLELSVARSLGKIGKRFEWGAQIGLGISSLDVAARGRITGNLVTVSEDFALQSATDPLLLAPGESSSLLTPNSPLNITPSGPRTTTTLNAASLVGGWKINGMLFDLKIGPAFIWNITERWKLQLTAGGLLTYVSTDFEVSETLEPTTGGGILFEEESKGAESMIGYYADLELQYWATERTAFYAAGLYESRDDYSQRSATRTATVDFGTSSGLRTGLSYRF